MGQMLWCLKVGLDLLVGVGSDGNLIVVGVLKGGVFVLGLDGKQLWKISVQGEIFLLLFVGNGFVVVCMIDGQVIVFNVQMGEQKWNYCNCVVLLNLCVLVGMMFVGDVVVFVGFLGGGFVVINLQMGELFWQILVLFLKGVIEVECINDVSGLLMFVGVEICVVMFQGQFGCFDVNLGWLLWEKLFLSCSGFVQDDLVVVGGDDWLVVIVYDVVMGNQFWCNDKLKSCDVGVLYLFGYVVVMGDYKGFVYFLLCEDGSFIVWMKIDGSVIMVVLVFVGNMFVVQMKDGGLYGFCLC